ncbi:hypothetical protein ACQKJC_08770 [Priestia koreensis]|uniref:hypothetical protein n=1 Tax=Priestia koreensis TaxID=284581 RepID=UPI003CFF0387
MVFITVKDNGEVELRNFTPFDPMHGLGKTEQELLLIGHLVESIPPEPIEKAGKKAILMWNGSSLYYKFADVPLTEQQKIDNLRNDLDSAIMELTLAVAMQQGG